MKEALKKPDPLNFVKTQQFLGLLQIKIKSIVIYWMLAKANKMKKK